MVPITGHARHSGLLTWPAWLGVPLVRHTHNYLYEFFILFLQKVLIPMYIERKELACVKYSFFHQPCVSTSSLDKDINP